MIVFGKPYLPVASKSFSFVPERMVEVLKLHCPQLEGIAIDGPVTSLIFEEGVTQSEMDHCLEHYNLLTDQSLVDTDYNLIRQRTQREFGQQYINTVVDLMGKRNLELSQQNVSFNLIALASDNSNVKLLIETGALTTAIGLCNQLKTTYTTHADIYDKAIEDIGKFLQDKGYI